MRLSVLALLATTVSFVPAAAQTSTAPAAVPMPLPSVTLPPELDRVLRDYEREWKAGKPAALASIFSEDGFVLQNGRTAMRGRAAIEKAYTGQSGPLVLRALAYATADSLGYIIGAYRYGDAADDQGKFTLTLKRTRGGPWLIFSDMDNSIQRRPASP